MNLYKNILQNYTLFQLMTLVLFQIIISILDAILQKKTIKVIMAIDGKGKGEKIQYDINKE